MSSIFSVSPVVTKFLYTLGQGLRPRALHTSLAIAKVIADQSLLPSTATSDIGSYYRNMCQINNTTKLSALNEVCALDTDTISAYIAKFYAIRYNTLYPSNSILCLSSDTALLDFFGMRGLLDEIAVKALADNYTLVMETYNNVNLFYTEVAAQTAKLG